MTYHDPQHSFGAITYPYSSSASRSREASPWLVAGVVFAAVLLVMGLVIAAVAVVSQTGDQMRAREIPNTAVPTLSAAPPAEARKDQDSRFVIRFRESGDETPAR